MMTQFIDNVQATAALVNNHAFRTQIGVAMNNALVSQNAAWASHGSADALYTDIISSYETTVRQFVGPVFGPRAGFVDVNGVAKQLFLNTQGLHPSLRQKVLS